MSFEAPSNYKIFSAANCANGNSNQEFFIHRTFNSEDDDSGYHHHEMDKTTHVYYDDENSPSSQTIDNLNVSMMENNSLSKKDALFMGITETEFDEIDTDGDGKISASQIMNH